MRRIVHLSDLHFGSLDERTLEPLREAIGEIAPDLVVVSGDLTQRARSAEFEQARAYLARLAAPVLAIPGNHDIPFWNVFERALRPLARYHRHFSPDSEATRVDAELAVVGVNTTRSFVIKGGRINRDQIEHVRQRFAALPDDRTKIVVSHHPIADAPGLAAADRAGRSKQALDVLSPVGVDLLLAGHLHRTDASAMPSRPGICERGVVGISAGTATSSRRRHEENGFNVLTIETERVVVARRHFDGSGFLASAPAQHFTRSAGGWKEAAARPADADR